MLGNYLVDIYRFIRMHRLFSLMKVLSLITGIITFFLFWLYRVEYKDDIRYVSDLLHKGALVDFFIALIIFLTMSVAYFFIQRSQMKLRCKDILIRKINGEKPPGILLLLAIETTVMILAAMVLGLVILDQIIPYLNEWTSMQVSIRGAINRHLIIHYIIFIAALVVSCGIIPSIHFSRIKAVDILRRNDIINTNN